MYVFEGCWRDERITAQPAEDGMDPILVFDYADAKELDIEYMPSEQLPEMDSLKVWYEVSKAIAEDDLHKADEAKQNVENAQRARCKQGAEDIDKPRKYFVVDSEGVWRWNGLMYNDKQVEVLDKQVDVSESVDETVSASGSDVKKTRSKKHAKSAKKLDRKTSATNTSASMSTSTDFSAVSETDFE